MQDSKKRYEERKKQYRDSLVRILNAVMNDSIHLLIPRPEESMKDPGNFQIHLTPEFIYQIDGSTEIRFPDETYVMQPGHLCIVPRSTPHIERIVEEEGFTKLVAMIRPDGFSLHVSKPQSYENPTRNFITDRYYRGGGSQIARYMDEIVAAKHSNSPHRRIILRGLLIALIGVLLDGMEGRPLSNAFPALKVPRCQELVIENLSDPTLSVEDLAAELNCSPDYLSRRFHQETGKTIVQVINEKRIDYAAELLCKTQLSVSEVAYASGYTTASYFIKVFRKLKDQTPGEYRMKYVETVKRK